MTVRPFPSLARARRQIMRRHGNEIPAHLLPVPREPQGQPGVYVLSTRRSADDGRPVTLSPGSAPAEVARRFSPAFVEQVNQARRPGTVSGPS